MRALLRDVPIFEDVDPVRPSHGRELVGDHQRRPSFHQPLQRPHYDLLGLGVEPGRRLIQDEYRGVPDHGAGDGDALPLSPRQRAPPLPDHGVEPFRQVLDEVLAVGEAGGLLNLLEGRFGTAVRDVLPDGRLEEQRLLQDHPDLLDQRIRFVVANVAPVYAHGALHGVVEAQDQARQGALPRAGGPHDRRHFARLYLQFDVPQHWLIRVVTEGDALEAHLPPEAGRGLRGGSLFDRRALVEHLHDALRPHRDFRELGPEPRKRVQRALKVFHVLGEDDERARGERPGEDLVRAEGDDRGQPAPRQDGHNPGETGLQARHVHVAFRHLARLLRESLFREAFPGERFDDPDRGDRLLRQGSKVPLSQPHVLLLVSDAPPEVRGGDHDEGCPRRGDQTDSPVDDEHDGKHADELQYAAYPVHE